MEVKLDRNGSELTVAVEGRVDTLTAPTLEEQVKGEINGVTKLVLDFTELKYISSAGLRVLLFLHQEMSQNGEMIVKNVCPEVMDVFDITGLSDALTENLPQVLEFIDQQLEEYNCPMKILSQIDLAVEEIFVNIASYAYNPEVGPATIRTEVLENPLTVVISFVDNGVQYDPLAKPDPNTTLSADERPIGGLGIFLAKKTMDDINYEYKEGQNILTIKKAIS